MVDLTKLWPVADYFVIATGSSARQMRSVCDEIAEMGQPLNFRAFRRNGYEGQSWIVIDFVDVVLHLFSPEARTYYDLENLWGDAPRVAWEEKKVE